MAHHLAAGHAERKAGRALTLLHRLQAERRISAI